MSRSTSIRSSLRALWRPPVVLLALGLLVFSFVFYRNAWISDDAFITLRTVSNAAKGYGLTWNTFERVQAYTHPLWMFLLLGAHLISGEYFYTTLLVSLLCSGLAVGVIVYAVSAKHHIGLGILALALLLSSKAFIDFTSSGLENPLIFLILAVTWLLLRSEPSTSERRLTIITLSASLLYTTRPDSILLIAPLWAFVAVTARDLSLGRRLIFISIGALPAIAWTIFSLIYYGFPFPNTAYAKLGTGIDRLSLMEQGGRYLLNSLRWDPTTLPVIVAGSALALRFGDSHRRAISCGVLAYLLYTVHVGGDFMSGRFLAAPFFLSTILLIEICRPMRKRSVLLIALLILVGTLLFHPRAPLRADENYRPLGIERSSRIADERGHYYRDLGLIPYRRRHATARPGTQIMHRAYQAGLRARLERRELSRREAIGMFGFAAGKDVRVIDVYALADPLLARLPAVNRERWRIGHFTRRVPPGYDETVRTGTNVIEDPSLREFYAHLTIITQGPLWSWQRIRTILAMNRGSYQHLIDEYLARSGAPVSSTP